LKLALYCLAFSRKISPVTSSSTTAKSPRSLLSDATTQVIAFPPNRETLGGTAYLLIHPAGNGLIDTPAWTEENQQFLVDHGVNWLFLTHRGGIGNHLQAIVDRLQCCVMIQEQEAYLIPEVSPRTFHHSHDFGAGITAIWTPGHSPGSSCLYSPSHGGILFSGRHLLPDRQGHPTPLRTAKTFHWPRQLRSTEQLRDRFTADTLTHICPGASIGLLRGAPTITPAYSTLTACDLTQLATDPDR
jgi:glyoxylase-like metal-dependent hydrolase (beta-lactamase superfamily II)